MYIIAGLGNPTAQYRGTRHNVGFEVIDYLADKYNIDVTTKKFKGLIGTGAIEGQKVVLVKPQTFMNLSGECIQEVMNYYKTDISDLIVVYDDINLEPGQLRVRGKGSAGGHNGMKNIIRHRLINHPRIYSHTIQPRVYISAHHRTIQAIFIHNPFAMK